MFKCFEFETECVLDQETKIKVRNTSYNQSLSYIAESSCSALAWLTLHIC